MFGWKLVAGFALAITLAGCAGVSTTETSSAPVATPPRTEPAPPVTAPQPPRHPPEPSNSSAWEPLLQKARQSAARGDYEQALALLERAQRIEPGAGAIYLELARVQQARGDLAQARTTAERGLLYCNSTAQCEALRGISR